MSPRRTRVARTSRTRPARRARLLTRRAKANAARRPRRGVLLLVVLSLLVLFLMVGMAFVITAKQSEKAAKSSMKASVRIAGEAAQADLLDEVLHQIIRDTNNPNSSLRFHSLLGDMYGNDGLKGVILPTPSMPSPPPATVLPPKFAGSTGGADPGPTGGQMLEFQIGTQATGVTVAAEMLRDLYGNTVDAGGVALTFSNIDNAYNGQVLTFLSGIAKGRSTRIVGFTPPNTFRVMNVQLADGSLIADPSLLATAANPTRVLINGRPFSGTGVGFNPWAIDTPTTKVPKLNAEEGVLIGGTPQFFPMALMPNAAFQFPTIANVRLPGTPPPGFTDPHRNYYFPRTTTSFFDYSGNGGANEGYDAPDFQNMALAYLPATQLVETALPNVTGALPPALAITGAGTMVIPSWHRPELLNYWANANTSPFKNGSDGVRSSFLSSNLDPTVKGGMMLRRVMLRPNWIDHPNFTGSNPELAAITGATTTAMGQRLARMVYGPWDVDNDNDGVRDSVWVDVGLPVMAGPNGKLVKPLAATLIIDMDGRANANAAGTCDLAEVWGLGADNTTGIKDVQASAALAAGVPSRDTPRGAGLGPADVNLGIVIDQNDFQTLLIGTTVSGKFYPGRYGFPVSGVVRPGVPGTFDLLSQIEMIGWPRSADVRSNFGAPSDLRARYGAGVNSHGQPIFDATLKDEVRTLNDAITAGTDSGILIDSPYELNLSQKTAAGVQGDATTSYSSDAPFSVAEMERLLRPFDADAGTLPGRLALLSGVLRNNANDFAARNKITSDSFDLPMPNVSLPHEMAEDNQMYSEKPLYRRPPQTAADLIEMRVRKALKVKGLNVPPFPEPVTGSDALALRAAMRRLVAPELANGSRLNVNRPIGNGSDNDPQGEPGYGVVDEPGEEVIAPQSIWQTAEAQAKGFNAQFPPHATEFVIDPNSADPNNPTITQQETDHRHLLARHLYVTALTLAAEPDYTGGSPTDKELARRLAQWAVNVVDFRDPDNINTPFEYDVQPFDGWDVNGWAGDKKPGQDGMAGTSDDVSVTPTDDSQNYRQLVWGAERPELLMTETMAWHDRNTTDEADEDPNQGERPADTTGAPPLTPADPDFDQLYRPRGAFFLELFNPWPETLAPSLDIHASNAAEQDLGVNLAASSVPTATARQGSPVWRVIVTQDVDPSKDPDDPEANNRPANIDRSIYFIDRDPDIAGDGTAFYRHQEDPEVLPVRPGRYMVVGSGKEDPAGSGKFISNLGQRLDQTPSQRPRKPLRRIELDTNNVEHAVSLIDNFTGDDTVAENASANTSYKMQTPSEAEASVSIPALASATPQTAATRKSIADVAVINGVGAGERRRFTLSEPANGYPSRVGNVEFTSPAPDPSEEGLYCNGGNIAQPKAIDTPLDDVDPELSKLGTDFTRGRRLFLQRLANPMIPYNADTNPYLTIDDTRAYITVFNGRLSATQQEAGARNSEARPGFSSVERGYLSTSPQGELDLWKTRAVDRPALVKQDTARMAINRADMNFSLRAVPQVTLGFLNRPYMNNAEASSAIKRVQPKQPFPWLAWNNRPFVSGNELMLVPRHRSSQLLKYFKTAEQATGWKQYDPTAPDDPQQFAAPGFQAKPFSHLENFFSTEAGATPVPGSPHHLYRLLELIETPSLFAGTETWLNPTSFNVAPANMSTLSTSDPRIGLLPPFNRISEFRDPGKININTISERDSNFPDRTVWDGIFHGRTNRKGTAGRDVHPGPALEEWVVSRRGYGSASASTLLDAAFPSVFANPLRAPDAGDMVPIPGMLRSGVDSTLLRSIDGTAGTSAAPVGEPLFATDLGAAGTDDYRNSLRNGFFRYQPIVRLDNLVTNRSNVYAVWVTIGFFEVEDAPDYPKFRNDNGNLPDNPETQALYNRVYPDGYAFGREDGVDVGNTRRLRGFYMIDRTNMAGYEPGADHNVENVIRLRRRIE